MEREKLILSQFRDKFYLSVPKEIEIGNYDYSGGIVTGKQIGRASCRERVSSPV